MNSQYHTKMIIKNSLLLFITFLAAGSIQQQIEPTEKSKCISETSSGICCGRAHSHDREMINCAQEPLKHHLRRCASALRVARKICGHSTWTLWNQSKVTININRVTGGLYSHPDCDCVCPRGAEKYGCLAFCKIEADQFVKVANPNRAFNRARSLLFGLQRSTGHDSIAISKPQRDWGHFTKVATKNQMRDFVVVPFADILAAMRYSLFSADRGGRLFDHPENRFERYPDHHRDRYHHYKRFVEGFHGPHQRAEYDCTRYHPRDIENFRPAGHFGQYYGERRRNSCPRSPLRGDFPEPTRRGFSRDDGSGLHGAAAPRRSPPRRDDAGRRSPVPGARRADLSGRRLPPRDADADRDGAHHPHWDPGAARSPPRFVGAPRWDNVRPPPLGAVPPPSQREGANRGHVDSSRGTSGELDAPLFDSLELSMRWAIRTLSGCSSEELENVSLDNEVKDFAENLAEVDGVMEKRLRK